MARPRIKQPVYRLIKRRANGVYYIHWTEGTRSRSQTTRQTTRANAQAYIDRWKIGKEELVTPDEPTIGWIMTAYAAARGSKIRSGDTLKYSIAPIIKHLGNLLPDDISDVIVEGYAKDRKRADGTVIRELGVLRAALHWGERQKLFRAPKFIMPVAHPESRQRWLTKKDARKLLDAARAPHMRLFITLALATGARTGAILDLQWEQIDWQRGVINFGKGHGKKRRGIVPVNNQLRNMLEEAKEVRTGNNVIEYGGKPIKKIIYGFKDCAKRAGVDCTPHVLRHTAATWMVEDGIPLREVARMLGDTEETIEKVYGHHSPEYLAKAAKTLQF